MLRELRVARGLTQKQISDKLGYTTSQFVSNWERGTAMPPAKSFPKLAKIYGVSTKKLIDFKVEELRQSLYKDLKVD